MLTATQGKLASAPKSMGVYNILRLDGQTTKVFNKAVVLKPGPSNITGKRDGNITNGTLVLDKVCDLEVV